LTAAGATGRRLCGRLSTRCVGLDGLWHKGILGEGRAVHKMTPAISVLQRTVLEVRVEKFFHCYLLVCELNEA
jgi:hypothetical protein